MPPSLSSLEESSAATVFSKKRKQSQDHPLRLKKSLSCKSGDDAPELKKISRNDLEQLVLRKIVEAITAKSKFGELSKKFEAMSTDYNKVKEKASALQKQLADLQEVTKRIKVLEETKTVRIPKITRSVGLQVTSKTKAEVEKEKKPTVIDIGNDEHLSSVVTKPVSKTVEEIIKNDPLDLLKQLRKPKKEVAKKSTGGKSSKTDKPADISRDQKSQEVEKKSSEMDSIPSEPLSLNVKKSSGVDGIVITWAKKKNNFDLDSIVSYELEGSKGVKGEKMKWSRIGNMIKPLPLPMACNLNNFKTGVLYHFRVKLLTKDKAYYSNISSIIL